MTTTALALTSQQALANGGTLESYQPDNSLLALTSQQALAMVGKMANDYADGNVFEDFNGRKADNTIRAYRSDLASFAAFLHDVSVQAQAMAPSIEAKPEDERTKAERDILAIARAGVINVTGDALQTTPEAWTGVTWGTVQMFVQWLLKAGASVATVNRKLAAVKVYAALAAEAGAIDGQDAARIANRVHGYTGKAARNVDKERTAAGAKTRQSTKKAAHVSLTADQVAALKTHPDTPQGRRDALLMALLLDHGLRVGEVALLTVDDFERADNGDMLIAFYRPKVGKQQKHRLSDDALRALTAYMLHDAPERGSLLFRQSAKGGQLKTGSGISERNLSERVRTIGRRIGIDNLSAHDCRHSWATRAVAGKTDAFALRDAGGWSSLAMPSRYVEAAAIANERVTLA